MAEEPVLSERNGDVMTISINRPDRRNALTVEAALAVHAALQKAAADKSLKAVIFRGRGNDFCCGADIKHACFQEISAEKSNSTDMDQFNVAILLHQLPVPTIAAIRGGCAGAGLAWASACDIRVAASSVVFNTAFLEVAVAGDMGGPWFLPKLIGAGRARDLYFFPRKFGSEEALQMGLVTRVFADDDFEREVDALSARMNAAAPLALRAMKSNFVDAERADLASFIALESERHARLFNTEDRVEAFDAYSKKRTAIFKGR
jgi:2-(1,2-epoxy-1,2-dihydrophenyl)acetyl-CoA isomerase